MSTFLVFSITARKEITVEEHEILDEDDIDPWEILKSHITPPYSGKCIVVDKNDTRTFRLRCNVMEVGQ